MWDICVSNTLITSTLFVFTAVFLLSFHFLSIRKTKHLPPCPSLRFPVAGHIHILMNRDLLGTFARLRRELGDIFRLEVGNATVIVINSYRLLYDAFVKHGDTFSHRPVTFLNEISRGRGILSVSGEIWKQNRRFVLRVLKDFGLGSSKMNTKIQKEIKHLLETFSDLENIEFDPKMHLQQAVANIIGGLIFGGSLDVADHRFKTVMKLSDENVRLAGAASILNFFPSLKWIPFDIFKFSKLKENISTMNQFYADLIDQHKRTLIKGNPRDLVDAYIEEIERDETTYLNSSFSNDQLVHVAGDMFIAGVETTVSNLRWMLVYLIRYPDIQTRLQRELDTVVGQGRLPCLEDRPNLVFTEAFLQEVLRHAHVSPNALPHTVSRDVSFNGFLIPHGAMIIPNIDSVMTDEEIWKDPNCFRLERFIGADGRIEKPKEFIPFFFGKRVCPGENLARMNIFLFLASMIKTYEITWPSGSASRAKGILGITYFPEDFQVLFKKRTHFYQ